MSFAAWRFARLKALLERFKRKRATDRFGNQDAETHSHLNYLIPCQLAVLDSMRLIRCSAEPRPSIRFVFRIVAVKPLHVALTFKRQNVCGDPIQEPSVVAD